MLPLLLAAFALIVPTEGIGNRAYLQTDSPAAGSNHSFYYDDKGADLAPWFRQAGSEIRHHWMAPYSAVFQRGHTVVTCMVSRTGNITNLRIEVPSSSSAFDRAAMEAVRAAKLLPLPGDYPGDLFPVVMVFWYNERPFDLFEGRSQVLFENHADSLSEDASATHESDGENDPPVILMIRLLRAAREGDVVSIEALLRRGIDVDEATARGETPLMMAAAGGHLGVMTALLGQGAEVNVKTIDDETALTYAARGGHVEAARLLLRHGAKVDVRSRTRVTPLIAAVCAGHPEVVRALLKTGADVNAERENGRTSLMFAAASGDVEITRILLDAGAKPREESKYGWTAASLAELYHHEEVRMMLGKAKSRVPIFQSSENIGADEPHTEPPRLKTMVQSEYTRDAQQRGVEGRVSLKVMVLENGKVQAIALEKSLDVGLDLNAIEAVRLWRFHPARRAGQSVSRVTDVVVLFELSSTLR